MVIEVKLAVGMPILPIGGTGDGKCFLNMERGNYSLSIYEVGKVNSVFIVEMRYTSRNN
jgi:hypothetical protein